MTFEEIANIPPFSLNKSAKAEMLTQSLTELADMHISSCGEYSRMMKAIGFTSESVKHYSDLPFLPVSLFKQMDLKSVSDDEVFKVTTSSGTTGQAVSKIFLDRKTASNQQKTLVKIVSDFTGSGRMPMLIIDSAAIIKNRSMFSARGAGIQGFSIFASDKVFALDDDMNPDFDLISGFIDKHKGKQLLIFGFTFMIWEHFYKELLKHNYKPDLSSCVLIHGGGWKKLINEAVSKETFRRSLFDVCGIKSVYDYYGMVEQTGSIYMECEQGHLHASIFSDILTRRHTDFSLCNFGEKGIIQLVSVLPCSYPGHSILTEDEGIVLGEDDCPCGRLGKYFEITGRLKNAEIRGCSDTYAYNG